MAKIFKKNQPIIAILPTGRVVEGFYLEPWGDDGHSFYVNEPDGERGGKTIFKKINYGVKDEFINPKESHASDYQYKAWEKRVAILNERIKTDEEKLKNISSDNSKEIDKLNKMIERNKYKLSQIEEKIQNYK